MKKELSKEEIEQIPILYSELKAYSKVAEKLGVSAAAVKKHLKEPEEKAPCKYSDEELAKLVNERYCDCKNMSLIARELNISNYKVKKLLSQENLSFNKQEYEDRDALWYYIIHLFGVEDEENPVSKWNITQMTRFKTQGMSYRAQLLTLKWYYEIEHNIIQEKYKTIGIIPYIFDRASEYYKKQDKKRIEFEQAIAKQLEKDRIEIKFNPKDYMGKRRKRKKINLEEVAGGIS